MARSRILKEMHCNKHHDLYFSSNIIWVNKSITVCQMAYVAHVVSVKKKKAEEDLRVDGMISSIS